MNNDRLLRWCYSNRFIWQIPYFNYFRITDIEKSEHNVHITMNVVAMILEWFTPQIMLIYDIFQGDISNIILIVIWRSKI